MSQDAISQMKSVVVFSANDTKQETERKWGEWLKNNNIGSVSDEYVPSLTELRKMLNAK